MSVSARPDDRLVRLQHEPLDLGEAVRAVGSPAAGAVNVFVGTTRETAEGKAVRSLEYEAYAPMAESEIGRIIDDVRRRWPVGGIAVLHRLGRVPAGEASIVIAVASAHRAEAFEASRYIIDTLKQTVPIWKREEFSDGTAMWSAQRSREGS